MIQQVKQEAARLCELHELGALKSEHQPWNPGFLLFPRWIFSLMVITMLSCGFLFLLFMPNVSLIGLFLLITFVSTAFLIIYNSIHPFRHSKTFLHEHGVILIKCKDEEIIGAEAINWRNIDIIRHVPATGDGGVLHGYRLQDRNGHPFGESTPGALNCISLEYIEQMTHPYLFPPVLFAYQQGASVPFGPIVLNNKGITCRGKFLPWNEFERPGNCKENGKLSIYKRDYRSFHRRPWAVVYCFEVPNIALLHHLIAFITSSEKPNNLSVTGFPIPLAAGKLATIIYYGHLARTAFSVTMHWGYNNWNGITDTAMTKQPNGSWQATITVPFEGAMLNMAFYDQNDVWDNHRHNNYQLTTAKEKGRSWTVRGGRACFPKSTRASTSKLNDFHILS